VAHTRGRQVRDLEEAVEQVKAIERPFLNWAGKAERPLGYFEQFDFVGSPADPLHLFVALKDVG
jgi:hypothetical protein